MNMFVISIQLELSIKGILCLMMCVFKWKACVKRTFKMTLIQQQMLASQNLSTVNLRRQLNSLLIIFPYRIREIGTDT